MRRGCVPDSVSLRFEFSFMNGSSFEPCSDHFGRVCYVVAFQIRFHEESVEYWLGHARVDAVAMLAVRQELESQDRQAC